MLHIDRTYAIGKWPWSILLSMGRNPKSYDRDDFYACANFDLHAGHYGLHVWINNRSSFGSYYIFSHRLINRFFRTRAYHRTGIHRYGDDRDGISFSILHRHSTDRWKKPIEKGKIDAFKVQWSRLP